MSKAYDLISESLNEIITDLEENDGKNLRRETVSLKIEDKITARKSTDFPNYIIREPLIASSQVEGRSYEN